MPLVRHKTSAKQWALIVYNAFQMLSRECVGQVGHWFPWKTFKNCIISVFNCDRKYKYILTFSQLNSARKVLDMAITGPVSLATFRKYTNCPLTFTLRWLSFNKPTIIPYSLCAIPRTIHLRRVAPDQMPERVFLLRGPSNMFSVVMSMLVTSNKLQNNHLYRLTLKTVIHGEIPPTINVWGMRMGNLAHADQIVSAIPIHNILITKNIDHKMNAQWQH